MIFLHLWPEIFSQCVFPSQNPLVFLAVSVAAVAASPAGVIYSPYSGLTGRVVYTGASPAVTLPALASPAVPLPASPVSPLSSVNTVCENSKLCLVYTVDKED